METQTTSELLRDQVAPSAGSGLKIAHIVNSLEVGGAEVLVALLTRMYRRSGHFPAIHCLVTRGPLAEQLEKEGFPIHVHGPRTPWELARVLYQEFQRDRPDVVHCHNHKATILGAPAAWLAGVRAIISTRHNVLRPPFRVRREVAFWLTARCCHRVVAVSEAVRRSLILGGGSLEKVLVVRNGTAPAQVCSGDNDPICKLGFTLITVARLAPNKDQGTLLRAVAIARSAVPDLYLWIVGDGPERQALQALATQLNLNDRVRFLGERLDVARWLAVADLFVLSSIAEGLPISLLEAMAVELPFVGTNVGALLEVAQMSGAGLIVPPGRPDALAGAIAEYANKRSLLPELGKQARHCYEQNFTPDAMAEAYLNLYRECLAVR